MATTWQEYQEEVAVFFRSLGLDATTNHSVQGVRTDHDVDVLVRSHNVGFEVTWIIECKYWNKPVSKLHVLALREIVTDVGADRGILLCEAGFQSGALEAATLTNVQASSLEALRGTATAALIAMRLRELFDRAESCRVRYWDIPKGARIQAGLRPGGGFGYSGNVVVELARDLLGKALRASYPFVLESMQGYMIFGEDREFANATEVLTVVEPMVVDLERRLAACEASLNERALRP